jgi:pyruvate/oxaloacetate carboxyltransferase
MMETKLNINLHHVFPDPVNRDDIIFDTTPVVFTENGESQLVMKFSIGPKDNKQMYYMPFQQYTEYMDATKVLLKKMGGLLNPKE